MNNRPVRQDRMDYMEKGAAIGKPREDNRKLKKAIKEIKDIREADERKEKEKIMDEWFENLTILQQSDVAYNFWDGASYEQKKEEYELE